MTMVAEKIERDARGRVIGADACHSCGGSGVWYGRGIVENGVFKGPTGDCFRCAGKGHQTAADKRRNAYYDSKVRRVYA